MRTTRWALAVAAGTVACLGPASTAHAAGTPGWQIVSSPNASSQNELASVAVVSATDAWAVGDEYAIVGGSRQELPLIEHYDGKAWRIVTSPAPSGFPFVALRSVTALSATDAWAAGTYYSASDMRIAHPLVEHYDGTVWNMVPVPQVDPRAGFSAVSATSPADVWAVGFTGVRPRTGQTTNNPLIEHYDGTAWSIVVTPTLPQTTLTGVAAISPANVWAVGGQSGVGAVVLHYDGSQWAQVTVAAPPVAGTTWGLDKVAASPSGQLWLTGSYTSADGSQHAFVEHFDGTAWSATLIPDPGTGFTYTSLAAVAASSNTDVWLTGSASPGDTTTTPFTEHFDGTAWHLVSVPHPSTGDSLGGVATNGTVAWAVGATAPAGTGAWQTLTELYS